MQVYSAYNGNRNRIYAKQFSRYGLLALSRACSALLHLPRQLAGVTSASAIGSGAIYIRPGLPGEATPDMGSRQADAEQWRLLSRAPGRSRIRGRIWSAAWVCRWRRRRWWLPCATAKEPGIADRVCVSGAEGGPSSNNGTMQWPKLLLLLLLRRWHGGRCAWRQAIFSQSRYIAYRQQPASQPVSQSSYTSINRWHDWPFLGLILRILSRPHRQLFTLAFFAKRPIINDE